MIKKEKVFFKNNRGLKLVGTLFTPDNFKSTILFSCGIGSIKEEWLDWQELFAKEGYRSLAFDYTGRGESEGKYEDTTLTVDLDDLKSALNFLNCEVALIGLSFGGQVAINLAARDKRVICLVTISASHNISEWDNGKRLIEVKKKGYVYSNSFPGKKYMLKLFEDAEKYNTLEQVNKIKIPFLIIHGDSDYTIPVRHAKEIYEKANEPKKLDIFKGEKHMFTEEGYNKAFELILQWFNKWLK